VTTTGTRDAWIEYAAVPSAALQDAAARSSLGGHGVLFGGLGAFLSAQERDASLRFRGAADRLDYAASHALFRLLAARRLGLRPATAAGLDVRRRCAGCGSTGHGKPTIEGAALSLSRSHGTVMAASAPEGASLGADVERVPAEVFSGFDEFVLAPEKRTAPDGPEPADSELAAAELSDAGRIRLWVAKEAALKASGLGLALAPSTVRLVPAGTRDTASSAGILRAECAGYPGVHGLLVTPVQAPDGYAAAVAAPAGLTARAVSLGEIFATKG
jgi:4'-phosphopantetheinyl transferase